MADFTALKNAIQTYIKQNGNEEITGEKLQEILLSVVTTLGDSAINDLVTALADEVAARQNADGTLQQNITNEATARGNADTALGGRIDDEATARANGDMALSNRLGSTITAENTAADQIGAEAEARAAADTALQELIDGITDNIENGYVYAGIATPSSTPATGKVFYLALTAGTYTNFGNTEVSQGINILKYNGSAWSLDAFIGIDDELAPGSNNLPKSGNVLENIIKNGSAFDLSAYNAEGGVLATYADLDAALTALNALPSVYKQPGMSFRFVRTSDNNYIKFFCMAQNFTTDVTQWQGVDIIPIINSKNLVESGGVNFFGSIKSNTSDIGILNELQSSFWNKNESNKIYRNTNYPQTKSANALAVSEGDVFNIKCEGFASVSSYYITNNNLEVIVDSESNTEFEGNIIIPAGGAYLFLNSIASGEIKALKEGSVIDTMTKELDSLRAQKPSLFVSIGTISNELVTTAYKFIKDIQITPPDGYTNAYLLFILKNAVISGTAYYSVNIRYTDGTNFTDEIYELSIPRSGLKHYTVIRSDSKIDIIVDWDSIEDGRYVFGEEQCEFNRIYLNEHIRDLSYYKGIKDANDYTDIQLHGYKAFEEIKAPDIFNVDSSVIYVEKQRAYSFIKDIQIVSISNSEYKYVYLNHILKNATIGGAVYYSVNLDLYDDEDNYVGIIFSLKYGDYNGIKYYNIAGEKSGVTCEIKIVVDWDYLADGNYGFTIKGLQIDDYYFKEHPGAVLEYSHGKSINTMNSEYGGYISQQKSNILRADQMFILNGEVVCTNSNRNNKNVYAKYAKADLGDTAKKIMCKFKTNQNGGDGLVCLCTMNTNSNSPVADITLGSVHITVYKTGYSYGLYVNNVWDRTSVLFDTPLSDNIEYEFGFEFLSNDVVKFYLPDGTTNEVTITGASNYNGRYVVFELYGTNTSDVITDDFPRYTITSFYAEPIDGIRLKDNFKREDGVLNIAPTGHVYRLFRNTTENDTIYDA